MTTFCVETFRTNISLFDRCSISERLTSLLTVNPRLSRERAASLSDPVSHPLRKVSYCDRLRDTIDDVHNTGQPTSHRQGLELKISARRRERRWNPSVQIPEADLSPNTDRDLDYCRSTVRARRKSAIERRNGESSHFPKIAIRPYAMRVVGELVAGSGSAVPLNRTVFSGRTTTAEAVISSGFNFYFGRFGGQSWYRFATSAGTRVVFLEFFRSSAGSKSVTSGRISASTERK
jgi:hypothetical protein